MEKEKRWGRRPFHPRGPARELRQTSLTVQHANTRIADPWTPSRHDNGLCPGNRRSSNRAVFDFLKLPPKAHLAPTIWSEPAVNLVGCMTLPGSCVTSHPCHSRHARIRDCPDDIHTGCEKEDRPWERAVATFHAPLPASCPSPLPWLENAGHTVQRSRQVIQAV